MYGFLWEVVGGTKSGGILVRQGEDVESPPEESRLSTGAMVRELALVGERLHFEKLEGSGPDTGWVSIKLKDGKDLVIKTVLPAPPRKVDRKTEAHTTGSLHISAKTTSYLKPRPPSIDRPKMRVLVLHGGGSNSGAAKFMSVQLAQLMKSYAEFSYINGDYIWDDRELTLHTPREAMENRIKGKDSYRGWYPQEFEPAQPRCWSQRECQNEGDPDWAFKVLYVDFEKHVDKLRKHIVQNGPFDVLVGFSQGANMLTAVAANILRDDGVVPWRLLVLFNGMWLRDERYAPLCKPPLDIPCVQVYGRNDHFRAYQGERLMQQYVNPIVMEHDGHHSFPPPDLAHSGDLYAEVAASMRWHCGLD